MTIYYSRTTKQLIQKQTLPTDAVEIPESAAYQIYDAIQSGFPFELLDDGTVTVAPTSRHRFYADKGRWIAYAYKYSPSSGLFYPLEMLADYADLPDDLIDSTGEVYQMVIDARARGLAYVVADGETVKVSTSVADIWDDKLGDFVRDKVKQSALDAELAKKQLSDAKTAKASEINNTAQSYIESATGADTTPAFEVQSWSLQGEEAKAWAADKSALTPTIDIIAGQRGVAVDVMRQKVLDKTLAYERLVAKVVGHRQVLQGQLKAAKTLADIDKIAVTYD